MNRCIALFVAFIAAVGLEAQESIIRRSNPNEYSVTIAVEVGNSGLVLSELAFDLPIPRNSVEQEITNLLVSPRTEILEAEGECAYAAYTFDRATALRGKESIEASISYTATVYDIELDIHHSLADEGHPCAPCRQHTDGWNLMMPIFQTYAYWYWYESGDGNVTVDYMIKPRGE